MRDIKSGLLYSLYSGLSVLGLTTLGGPVHSQLVRLCFSFFFSLNQQIVMSEPGLI